MVERDPRIESPYAWVRLTVAVLIGMIGGVGLWSVVVALPTVQQEFGVDRAGAALPYTLGMFGLVFGGVIMGKLSDRFGVVLPVVIGSISLCVGYLLMSQAHSLTSFAIIYGVFVGFLGSSSVLGTLIADVSHWFGRRRGIAVAIVSTGSYFAGAVWPPILQAAMATWGWRATHVGIGIFCLATMLPLVLLMRRPGPVTHGKPAAPTAAKPVAAMPLGLRPSTLQTLIIVAGIACCVAMAMPQVHIVAYCTDLGYGPARGAEMLALMLATGTVSRLVFGVVMDRIGGIATLVVASILQAIALSLFLPFDGLISLYVISGLFGLFQGGLVPSYAMIARALFPPQEAGSRVAIGLSATLAGMALGGWMSGAIFDATGTYQWAIVNGIAWNMLNLGIAVWLLLRARRMRVAA